MDQYTRVPTPWGASEGGSALAPGVTFYHTPSHGGLKVDPPLNERIPAAFRDPAGWYEEDYAYLIVLYFLDEYLREHARTHGAVDRFERGAAADHRRMLEFWFPAACVVHFGTAYSDEELARRHTDRATLDEQVDALRRRLAAAPPAAR